MKSKPSARGKREKLIEEEEEDVGNPWGAILIINIIITIKTGGLSAPIQAPETSSSSLRHCNNS